MSVSPVSPQLQAAIEEEALKLSKGIALGDCNIMLQAPNPIRSSNKLPWFMDRIDQLTAENQKLKAEAEQTIKLTNGASVSFVSNQKDEKLKSMSDDWATLKEQALLQQNTPLVNEEIKRQVNETAIHSLYHVTAGYLSKTVYDCFVKSNSFIQALIDDPDINEDPDGPLTPPPSPKPVPRTITAPQHDFIGALYKPYEPPV